MAWKLAVFLPTPRRILDSWDHRFGVCHLNCRNIGQVFFLFKVICSEKKQRLMIIHWYRWYFNDYLWKTRYIFLGNFNLPRKAHNLHIIFNRFGCIILLYHWWHIDTPLSAYNYFDIDVRDIPCIISLYDIGNSVVIHTHFYL